MSFFSLLHRMILFCNSILDVDVDIELWQSEWRKKHPKKDAETGDDCVKYWLPHGFPPAHELPPSLCPPVPCDSTAQSPVAWGMWICDATQGLLSHLSKGSVDKLNSKSILLGRDGNLQCKIWVYGSQCKQILWQNLFRLQNVTFFCAYLFTFREAFQRYWKWRVSIGRLLLQIWLFHMFHWKKHFSKDLKFIHVTELGCLLCKMILMGILSIKILFCLLLLSCVYLW